MGTYVFLFTYTYTYSHVKKRIITAIISHRTHQQCSVLLPVPDVRVCAAVRLGGGLLVHDPETGHAEAAGQPARLQAALHPQGHLPARANQTHARPEGLHREENAVL